MLLQADNVVKSFGADVILAGVNLIVNENERIGIVGPNGAGKTTLLRILVGDLQPDSGKVTLSGRAGYLAQGSGLESSRTVTEEMEAAFEELIDKELQLRQLEEEISSWDRPDAAKQLQRITAEYADLEEDFRKSGGYSFRGTIRGVLNGLGFTNEDGDRHIATLSGGQKARLALASLLMVNPEVLILDEPTNYLDLDSLSWLEKHLQSYSGSVLVVSHDRYFLDKVVSIIYELENHKLTRYTGNYSSFIKQKTLKADEQARKYRGYIEEKTRLEQFAAKNIVRASTSGRAKSALKKLDKMQPVPKPAKDNRRVGISFRPRLESGRQVVIAEDLIVGYGNTPISPVLNLEITKGERVALLGPNGVGKTTLLKTIMGILKPLQGTIHLGHNVEPVYLDQEQELLTPENTVLDELWDVYPERDEADIRTVLGRFLFSGEEVFKKVSALSGGEKARLMLAKTVCKGANFLVLDEPTNHLDLYSREALEDAIQDYPGTLLFVSHDRYFINSAADRILELSHSGINDFLGDFDYYLEKKKSHPPTPPKHCEANGSCGRQPGKDKLKFLRDKEAEKEKRRRLRRAEQLEELIESLEREIKSSEEALQSTENANYTVYQEISDRLETLHLELEVHLEEWISLRDRIEDHEGPQS